MKHIIVVSKETSNDTKKMENIALEAMKEGHPGGAFCISGYSIEFQLEEEAINQLNKPETRVFKVSSESGKLVPFEGKEHTY